jgi:hypothetical protein
MTGTGAYLILQSFNQDLVKNVSRICASKPLKDNVNPNQDFDKKNVKIQQRSLQVTA